ncbi:MAG TPA: hypothetical protein DIW64_18830 [Cellvibrio sp.]|nr:hypothetical protein [Cellvibrio sp.]
MRLIFVTFWALQMAVGTIIIFVGMPVYFLDLPRDCGNEVIRNIIFGVVVWIFWAYKIISAGDPRVKKNMDSFISTYERLFGGKD